MRIVSAILLVACVAPAYAQRWDAFEDWREDGAQPHHGWGYFEYDGETGAYRPLQWSAPERVWKGSEPYAGIWRDTMCTSGMDMVRSWTAPADGLCRVTAREKVRKSGTPDNTRGDGVRIRLYRNRLPFFDRHLAFDDFEGFALDESIRVNAGDTIYIHVNPNSQSGWDSATFSPVIQLTAGDGYDQGAMSFSAPVADGQSWRSPADGALHIDSQGDIAANAPGALTLARNSEPIWTQSFGGDEPVKRALAIRTFVRAGDTLTLQANPANAFQGKLSVELSPVGLPERKTVELEGDQHITADTVWADGHYRIRGNLYLEKGATLSVLHSTVELMCTYAREFNVWFRGGTLVTDHATVGGTNATGRVYHCNFELTDGAWFSTDTVVRYSYGQVFGHEGKAKLRGLRHNAGPHSDSVIMAGHADVVLKDSSFPIALNIGVGKEGDRADLSMPVNAPLNITYDNATLPGVEYRLRLINHVVPCWFLFVGNVTSDGPPAEVVLRDCTNLISGLMTNNLRGEASFPTNEPVPRALEPNSALTVGNVTFRTLDKPATFWGWCPYLSGEESDFTMRGPTTNGELMVWDGKYALLGEDGTYNAHSVATTMEIGRHWGAPSRARALLRNVSLGHFSGAVRGQITVRGQCRVLIDHARLGDLLLITHDDAKVYLRDIKKEGEFTVDQQGGEVIYVPDGNPVPSDWDVIEPKFLGDKKAEFAALESSPAIDGKADDACWKNIPWTNLCDVMTKDDGLPPADTKDLAARFKSGWREQRLYLLVEVTDDVLDHNPAGGTWMQDSCEVYLNLSNAYEESFLDDAQKASDWWDWRGGPSHLRFGADGKLAEHTTNGRSPMRIPQQAAFVVDTSQPGLTRYEIEMKPGAPKDDVSGFSDAHASASFGFALQVNDADGGARERAIAWLGGNQLPLGQYHPPVGQFLKPTLMPEALRMK